MSTKDFIADCAAAVAQCENEEEDMDVDGGEFIDNARSQTG